MEDKYDKNGYCGSDFKRNTQQEPSNSQIQNEQDGEDGAKLNEKAGEYMRELLSEKIKMDHGKFPISTRLIDQEVTRIQSTGRLPPRDYKFVDVFREKPVKVVVKVLVPIKEHPKFNFVGKLLGPKGNTMKHLQEETMCKMAILGRGSVRDRKKEDDMRNSLDPKYAHLSDELHVEISAMGPPAEAHARIAYALAEVRKYLIPDTNDVIRQSQMREMIERAPRPGMPPGRAPPRMVPGPPQGVPRPGLPAKTKVISILDRARSAMEETYQYDDPYGMQEPPVRGPPRAPEPDYYGYDRGHEQRYYEDDGYYKEEGPSREYNKASSRDVGTRRVANAGRHYARASPYNRPAK